MVKRVYEQGFLDILVDPVCGIVRELGEVPLPEEVPDSFHCVVASVSDPRQFSVWLADKIAGASGFGEVSELWAPAVGEAAERYCGNNIPTDLLRASPEELAAAGRSFLDPLEFPAFDESLFTERFPYQRYDPAAPILWARATDGEGEEILVPGSRVYLNWNQGSRRHEPRTHHIAYAGIAAGPSKDFAELAAFRECVERDVTTAWWSLGLPAQAIDPATVPGMDALRAQAPDFDIDILFLPNPEGMPVFAALVYHRGLRIPGAGFSCHGDPASGVWKALSEAFQVWISMHGVLEADGTGYRSVAEGLLSAKAYFPHQPDRRYLELAGERWENVRDLACQAQLWLDERLHPHLDRFRPAGERIALSEVPAVDMAQAWRSYRGTPSNRVATVDVTTKDIRLAGLHVARVLCPRLLPNFPSAFPVARSPRWKEHWHFHHPGNEDMRISALPLPHM
ncbi:YcaO-like family protein [Corynebacterium uropygiale]|uniref:YcaO-like family protein n=1 Tax=Corynebacterium uropygiale TaxID=1775911 RepID=A0A9X1TYW4_9CORY|nr:YcaO-like family protein [Corynebacterium uropygiale]